jgi:hypothetical protein
MKKCLVVIVCLHLFVNAGWAQNPGVKWSNYLHTYPDFEGIYDGQRTGDKGYILIGFDTGFDFKTRNIWSKLNNGTGWLVKLDSVGNTSWHKRLGGAHYATGLSVQEIAGGYITAGHLRFDTDTANYFIAKLDGSGNQAWLKRYGGSGDDRAYSIKATTDGGYIIAGYSNSVNGDVVQRHQGPEAWIVKLDGDGNKQWAYTYGGTSTDTAFAICQMIDGGYLVCGTSSSADGDMPANKGSSDGWVFKLDAAGALVWKKNFGGSGQDVLNNMVRNADNTYTLSGYSFSNNGDVSSNHGSADFWVIKIDDTGNLFWSKLYGGSRNDASFGLNSSSVNGSFVTGFTESADGQVTDAVGGVDCWTLRLDANGILLWQKASGTVNNEYAMAVMPTSDTEFAIAGLGYPLIQDVGGDLSVDLSDGLIIKYSYANSIKGTVYLDANSNGTRDAGEKSFDHAIVKTQKQGLSVSAIPYNGSFRLDVDTGTFTTSVQLFSQYYNVVPALQISTFSADYNQDSIGFAVQPLPNKKDLFITLNAVDPARPGFDVRYRVFYKNMGNVDMPSGTVQLTVDPKFSYQSATTTPTLVAGNIISWNYTNLNVFDSATILVTLRLAAPPGANIGDTIRSVAVIGPVTGDETPADDTAVLRQLVTGSYDPNDKTESNAGVITPTQVNEGEYLHYLIRFQNTGTDTAFSITVRDTLEGQLDWSSLQMLSASHAYQLAIEDGNRLSWQFNNIMLPYTGINEPASHGYIAYRIKPVSTVQVGDTIKNTASIYFDFNPAIITNTERTVVLLLTPLPITLVSFQATVMNDDVNVTWKTSLEDNIRHFEVERSANGVDFTKIGSVQAGPKNYLFIDKEPLVGNNYYRLKSLDKDGSYSHSAVAMVNVSNNAVISTVYPNPGKGNITLRLQGLIGGDVQVQVLDQMGRQLLSKELEVQRTTEIRVPLELGRLNKGSYVLRIMVADKVYLHKLLIQ